MIAVMAYTKADPVTPLAEAGLVMVGAVPPVPVSAPSIDEPPLSNRTFADLTPKFCGVNTTLAVQLPRLAMIPLHVVLWT